MFLDKKYTHELYLLNILTSDKFIMFIIYSKERKKNSSNTHTTQK